MNFLVIHGVANRDAATIHQHARSLEERLKKRVSTVNLIPCYWGDLGAKVNPAIITTNTTHTLSTLSQTTIINETLDHLDPEVDEVLVEAALEEAVSSSEFSELQQLFATTEDADQQLGRLLAAAYNLAPSSTDEDEVETLFPKALVTFLESLEPLIRLTLEANLTASKNNYSEQGLHFLGDAFLYQHDPVPFQQRVLDTLKEYCTDNNLEPLGTEAQPVSVIAHSFGGIITFDMAMREQLWIDHLFTMGSQPAFFNEITQQVDRRHRLKPTIKTWHNFYEPLDMLAYRASGFTLHSGHKVEDVEIRCGRVVTHGCYWESAKVLEKIIAVIS